MTPFQDFLFNCEVFTVENNYCIALAINNFWPSAQTESGLGMDSHAENWHAERLAENANHNIMTLSLCQSTRGDDGCAVRLERRGN